MQRQDLHGFVRVCTSDRHLFIVDFFVDKSWTESLIRGCLMCYTFERQAAVPDRGLLSRLRGPFGV